LACVNRKIAERVTNSSNAHVHAIFTEAAYLAGRAIEAATELQRMPGMSAEAFAETLDFWCHVRDYAETADLDSLGENTLLSLKRWSHSDCSTSNLALASSKQRARNDEPVRRLEDHDSKLMGERPSRPTAG